MNHAYNALNANYHAEMFLIYDLETGEAMPVSGHAWEHWF